MLKRPAAAPDNSRSMSDWRPRDPTGPGTGAPPPPGWGTPFPPEKPRRDAPQTEVAQSAQGVSQYQAPPYGAPQAPYGAAPAQAPYGGAPAQAPYGAAPAQAPYGAAPATAPAPAAPPAAPAGYSAHSYAAATVPGVPLIAPLPDPLNENRRGLDWRRIRAWRLDALLMVPIGIALIVMLRHRPITAYFMILAVNLSYHFVMETVCGQTFGKRWKRLRVVKRDGSPAGASAIAARTVFRIIDAQFIYLVGLITMVITGKRRQRIGDLAAGTIVRDDDRPWKPAPASPLLVIYPVLWVAGALFFGHLIDPKPVALTSDPYMQQVDRACAYRLFTNGATPANQSFDAMRQASSQETSAIEALPPPPTPEAAYGVAVVLKWRHKIDKTAARIVADAQRSGNPPATFQKEAPQLLDVIKRSDKHMARLGLPHCIDGPGYIATP